MLTAKFKMKYLGNPKHFLCVNFDQSEGAVRMNQKTYTRELWYTRWSTSCEQKLGYNSDSDPVDPKIYYVMVGSLIYLMTCIG